VGPVLVLGNKMRGLGVINALLGALSLQSLMGGSQRGMAFSPGLHHALPLQALDGVCCRRAVLALASRACGGRDQARCRGAAPFSSFGALARWDVRARPVGRSGERVRLRPLAMRRGKQDGGVQPTDDPLEAMQKWSSLLQTGRARVDDLKMKTMQALDNLFSGGFMQEGEADNDLLPVLRKFMMYDIEGCSPPQAQSSLMDDFEKFGAPQALTAPSLRDESPSEASSAFQAGGASVSGWGREQGVARVDDGRLDLLQPLNRQQFSRAVQSGLSGMAAEDIDLVFDNIDKDGDGTLTLEELYETYKTVQAELVTDQEIKEMSVRDFELSAAKLRPETPDAAFSNVLPSAGDRLGEPAPAADDTFQRPAASVDSRPDLSARMAEWEEVCRVLMTQAAYLPSEGQEMIQQAVELSGQALLARGADPAVGSLQFGDGLALGGIVAGLQSQSEAVCAAVLVPGMHTAQRIPFFLSPFFIFCLRKRADRVNIRIQGHRSADGAGKLPAKKIKQSTHAHVHTNTQTHKHTNTQTHKHTNTHEHTAHVCCVHTWRRA